MSSSIPSWQILTAHVQPVRGARDLAFCLKVPLDSLLVWASSEGSGETARMRRLAWTFAARIGDKYQIRLTRSSYSFLVCIMMLQLSCLMTKPTKWLCAQPEDSDQPGHPPSLIRVFAVRMKKAWVLSYTLSAQRRLWSDWADARADLSIRWAHSHFVGFVMSWLNWQLLRSWTGLNQSIELCTFSVFLLRIAVFRLLTIPGISISFWKAFNCTFSVGYIFVCLSFACFFFFVVVVVVVVCSFFFSKQILLSLFHSGCMPINPETRVWSHR